MRAAAAGLFVAVACFLLASTAHAHPLGLPAFAQITAGADGTVTVAWNAAPDDIAVLARDLGVAVPQGGVLTRAQDETLSRSPALATALTTGIGVEQGGRPCVGTSVVTSLVEDGATVRFACAAPVSDVVVRLTLLTGIDERYRTLAVAGTTEGAQRVMFTATAPEHPLRLDPAAADVVAGAASAPRSATPGTARTGRQPFGGSLPFESSFVALIDQDVAVGGLLLGLLIALGVGAVHGLAPGHGKAIAAAYLVGDRGRPRDAVLLGVVVAAMHTWSVLALGFALYSATQRPATAALSAWLQLVTALVLVGLGVWLLVRRLRERRRLHEHDHVLADEHPLSWKGIVALGAAGGLLPSPSALLVLFTALAIDRLAYGLLLIAVFSIGLAASLSAVGLAVLKGRDLARARVAGGRVGAALGVAPLVGAAAVAVLGSLMAVGAIRTVLSTATG